MTAISRRSFLAATATAAVTPIFGALAAEADVVVVGAGAAGIAAARRIRAAGRSVTVVEASARVGGRCITDNSIFGMPFDLGAHWLHLPESNPLVRLAPAAGLDVYRAPSGQRLRIGRRYAREGELEDFLAALVKCNRAFATAASRGKPDISCAQALPKDIGDLGPLMEFLLGPFEYGKDLSEISVMDAAKAVERDSAAFCRQGLGALLEKLAAGLPVQLSAPVSQIDVTGRGMVNVATARGQFTARSVIVTVSTNMLASGRIKFTPELPKRQLDAAAKLSLGSYDRIALELTGNPLGLQSDDIVFEKSAGHRTAALLANVSGSTLAYIDVGGSFGRDLSAQGTAGMTDFATHWLSDLYGTDIGKAVQRSHATQWNAQPWVMGAASAAAVGGQPGRQILMEPLRGRIFFAGEAVHETLWGTVGGAWESGERAANAALKLFEPQRPAARRTTR